MNRESICGLVIIAIFLMLIIGMPTAIWYQSQQYGRKEKAFIARSHEVSQLWLKDCKAAFTLQQCHIIACAVNVGGCY